jgi:D-alanyl-D-alanine carboxypeptidase
MSSTARLSRSITIAALLVSFATSAGAGVFGDPSTYEQARRYLGRHANDVALVCYTAKLDGGIEAADPSIFHNADTPMPLASTIKIVLLAGYARDVAAGRLDPEQPVSLADWERFYLPATDGGAHPASLADLGLAADECGFATDSAAIVPLRALVWAMIAHSDNAAADWVLERIGDDGWAATVAEGGLAAQDEQLPIVGQFLAWANHERPALSPAEVARFGKDRAAFAAEAARLTAAFQDREWRLAELGWRLEGHDPSTLWSEAKLADALAPRGTARDYARLMAGVITGTFISPGVSALMRKTLEWPMADPQLALVFEAFGTKGGSFSGVLTSAMYDVPKVGDFAGRTRVCVLLMRRMPMLAWLSMSLTGAEQVLQLGLLGSRDFTEKVRSTLPTGR